MNQLSTNETPRAELLELLHVSERDLEANRAGRITFRQKVEIFGRSGGFFALGCLFLGLAAMQFADTMVHPTASRTGAAVGALISCIPFYLALRIVWDAWGEVAVVEGEIRMGPVGRRNDGADLFVAGVKCGRFETDIANRLAASTRQHRAYVTRRLNHVLSVEVCG